MQEYDSSMIIFFWAIHPICKALFREASHYQIAKAKLTFVYSARTPCRILIRREQPDTGRRYKKRSRSNRNFGRFAPWPRWAPIHGRTHATHHADTSFWRRRRCPNSVRGVRKSLMPATACAPSSTGRRWRRPHFRIHSRRRARRACRVRLCQWSADTPISELRTCSCRLQSIWEAYEQAQYLLSKYQNLREYAHQANL